MTVLSREQAASREKTLLVALLLSVPGPLVTGLAAMSSHSTTQMADFTRRTVELVALFVSWWIFHQLRSNAALEKAAEFRLENAARLGVAIAMIFSGSIMLFVALSRWSLFEPGGNVVWGLVIAVLGAVTNGWFWRRYTILNREKYSSIIAAQKVLYRAKASVDLCVVVALTAVAMAPTHPATHYVDILGSVTVAAYLMWSGLRMALSQPVDSKGSLGSVRRQPRRLFWHSARKEND